MFVAGCMPNNGLNVPVSAIFSSGLVKGRDREDVGWFGTCL